jgi:hypothetical protein
VKVVMRSNGDYQEVLADGKSIIEDDGINTDQLLWYLAKAIGFEYVREDGDWDKNGNWKPTKT